ncbi:hypothetical protein D3C87_1649250 [compost metagenome]
MFGGNLVIVQKDTDTLWKRYRGQRVLPEGKGDLQRLNQSAGGYEVDVATGDIG